MEVKMRKIIFGFTSTLMILMLAPEQIQAIDMLDSANKGTSSVGAASTTNIPSTTGIPSSVGTSSPSTSSEGVANVLSINYSSKGTIRPSAPGSDLPFEKREPMKMFNNEPVLPQNSNPVIGSTMSMGQAIK
jgi:hypothetical protein